jgi:nicotinamidase-related amidase
MPHWKRDGYWACVEGTPGAAAPDRLEPASGEPVIGKTFYSGFSVPELDSCLRATGARTLVVAGLYLHACVSATVLDAYQRGYSVLVGADAVASRSSEQLDVARDFLSGRAAMFRPVAEIVATLDSAGESA